MKSQRVRVVLAVALEDHDLPGRLGGADKLEGDRRDKPAEKRECGGCFVGQIARDLAQDQGTDHQFEFALQIPPDNFARSTVGRRQALKSTVESTKTRIIPGLRAHTLPR